MGFGLDAFGKNLKNQATSGFAGYTPSGLKNTAKSIPGMLGNTVLSKVSSAITDFVTSPSLRDFTHASKVFVANSYQNAPKQKHLFHVHFGLSSELLASMHETTASTAANANYGLLVKSVDLPKFQLSVTEMNQYNRKRNVQSKVTYDPIKIQFHDDGGNAINSLWFAYFTYHYRDSANNTNKETKGQFRSTPAFDKRNVYDPNLQENMEWGFHGELEKSNGSLSRVTGSKTPFFSYISIYSFNQKTYTEYRLMNPIIESFGHDSHEYSSSNGVLENTMTLRFESVQYYSGLIGDRANPVAGFGDKSNYDTTNSPLKNAGSSNSIDGDGGLLDSIGQAKDKFASGDYLGALKDTARTATTFKNPATLLNSGMKYVSNSASSGELSRNLPFKFPF